MKTKKVLAILSEYGYWGIELVGPFRKLEKAGYTIDFKTPNHNKAKALQPSYDTTFIDAPLGVEVTTQSNAKMVKEFMSEDRLEKPSKVYLKKVFRKLYSTL